MKKKFIFSGVVLIFCLPLCIAAGYLYSLTVPREYYSKVTMAVAPFDNTKIQAFDSNNPPPTMPQVFQSIQSKDVLYPVIDELKLVEKWAARNVKLPKEQIYFRLLKMMDVKQLRNTDLLEIGVYSRDPLEAANIANAIAVQYQKRRIDDEQKMYGLSLSELRDELDKQRQKVESAHAEMLKIRERSGSYDYEAPGTIPTQTPEDKKLSDEYMAAKTKNAQEKKNLEDAETRWKTQIVQRAIRSPVKIWEKAEPADMPIRPNVPLFLLFATGIGMFFAVPGVVLLVVGLCMKDSPIGRGA